MSAASSAHDVASRRARERAMSMLAFACLVAAVAPFVAVAVHLLGQLRISSAIVRACGFALLGSLELGLMTAVLAVPVGVLAGMFLAELGGARLAKVLRLGHDVLAGVPPIVIGLFVYAVVVLPLGGFSLFAGAVALALTAVPAIALATDELLRLVPAAIRDAGLGLGLPRHRVVMLVLLRAIAPGLGSMIALTIARVLGETSALLFTAGSSRWLGRAGSPETSPLPIEIFVSAQSPYADDRARAAAMTLTLLAFVALIGALGRALRKERA